MNPEVKKMWVEALRSGKYKQGTGQLRTVEDEYCCLGVLCDISGLGGWLKPSDSGYIAYGPAEYDDVYLPDGVREWAGLNVREGAIVSIGNSQKMLASHNDDGVTFKEIADAIEAQL